LEVFGHHGHQPASLCTCLCVAGDEIYREWGWNMFRAFERWTRLDSGGYATINNVNAVSSVAKLMGLW